MSIQRQAVAASFRDPSGFVFRSDEVLYRQVNTNFQEHYDHFTGSGLCRELLAKGWLIPFEEVVGPIADAASAYKILRPEAVGFVSYPYEWCFSQLKDAALLTLDIQHAALNYGMTLKDASAYNIQFHNGRPILIDTLSFERYTEGQPWLAYRQFCEHFLAPLALMSKIDARLGQLLRIHLDGVPLDLASCILPSRTLLNLGLAIHLHLHSRVQRAFARKDKRRSRTPRMIPVRKKGLIGLIEGLQRTVGKLDWRPEGTEWADYYQATNYSDNAFQEKGRVVDAYLRAVAPMEVWDIGANVGLFSRLATKSGIPTVAFDVDPAAVEINYRTVKERGEKWPLPLLLDLTNPSPGLGWNNTERDSLIARGPVDCVMALALMHHLVISHNVPLPRMASFFAGLCHHLIIEFIPKSDSQVRRLLGLRKDIFEHYDEIHFEQAFARYFTIEQSQAIKGSQRVLYLMKRRAS